jgi:hypothetical protein
VALKTQLSFALMVAPDGFTVITMPEYIVIVAVAVAFGSATEATVNVIVGGELGVGTVAGAV